MKTILGKIFQRTKLLWTHSWATFHSILPFAM